MQIPRDVASTLDVSVATSVGGLSSPQCPAWGSELDGVLSGSIGMLCSPALSAVPSLMDLVIVCGTLLSTAEWSVEAG